MKPTAQRSAARNAAQHAGAVTHAVGSGSRRWFLHATAAVVGAALIPRSRAQALPEATMYLSEGCQCCRGWQAHMQAHGFRLKTVVLGDMAPTKRRLGVPEDLYSCHTAVVGAYVIEGHVPAADVKRLLRERLAVRGLAVPGMVAGSPGMEGPPPQAYATLAFGAAGTRVFERH